MEQESRKSFSETESFNKYGLDDLSKIINEKNIKKRNRTLGVDISDLNLNLDQKDSYQELQDEVILLSSEEEDCTKKGLQKIIPFCYNKQKAREVTPKLLSFFSDEALFYVFFSSPGKQEQIISANELKRRGWLFQKEQWILYSKSSSANGGKDTMFFNTEKWEISEKENKPGQGL